jgi:hypothetical protein
MVSFEKAQPAQTQASQRHCFLTFTHGSRQHARYIHKHKAGIVNFRDYREDRQTGKERGRDIPKSHTVTANQKPSIQSRSSANKPNFHFLSGPRLEGFPWILKSA